MLYSLMFILFAVVIGLMFLFSGYRFFRVLLPVWAFFVGIFAGMSGFSAIFGESLFASSMGFLLGLVLGVIFALLAYYAYALAVVVYGATLGYALGAGLMTWLGFESFMPFVVGLVTSVAFVVLFMSAKVPRLVIMVTTSLAGSMALIMALFVLIGPMNATDASLGLTSVVVNNSFLWTLMWLGAAAFGFAAQYVMEKQTDMMTVYMWDEEFKSVTAPSTPDAPTPQA